jgi:hypothetical protein
VATAAEMSRDVDYEDVTVARIGARVVLAAGIESCVSEAALDISGPTNPVLVGKFTPRVNGPAEMWGVALDTEGTLVFGSDIRTGLWILRPTGATAP